MSELKNPITILFLAAEPNDSVRLRLGQELRDIRERLQLSKNRDNFILESREAVRPSDITQALFDVSPQIIHFSGHGTLNGELCFEDIQGKVKPVTPGGLSALFQLVSKQVNCVILNACYSKIQAEAISEHIPYVIGMTQEIGDLAAIAFSTGFYKALSSNHSVIEAYKFGCAELLLQGMQEDLTPILHSQSSLQATTSDKTVLIAPTNTQTHEATSTSETETKKILESELPTLSDKSIVIVHTPEELRAATFLAQEIRKLYSFAAVSVMVFSEIAYGTTAIEDIDINEVISNSKVVLLLLSHDSCQSQWIHMVTGCARTYHKPIFSLLFRELEVNYLNLRVYRSDRSVKLNNQKYTRDFIETQLPSILQISPRKLETEHINLDIEIQRLWQGLLIIGRELDEQLLPTNPRAQFIYYLYYKSSTQFRMNDLETGSHPWYWFRKPDIYDVFELLMSNKQPAFTILNLDEFWIKPLAEKNMLVDLSRLGEKNYLSTLINSSKTHNGLWSVPHFADFSFYACQRNQRTELITWLHELKTVSDVEKHVSELRSNWKNEHLFVYDFRTTDTVASVILEFCATFGDGISSLYSSTTAISENNIRAIQILRNLVGGDSIAQRKPYFQPGDPLKFQNLPNWREIPFFREWHSRCGDMKELFEVFEPNYEIPMITTIGGWHIGVLVNRFDTGQPIASETVPEYIYDALTNLLTQPNQLRRLEAEAGIPTRTEFFDPLYRGRLRDPITGWRLSIIKEHLERSIRRSDITSYPELRKHLANLHTEIMEQPVHAAGQIFVKWALECLPQ